MRTNQHPCTGLYLQGKISFILYYRFRSENAVSFLLSWKVDIEPRDVRGNTPLMVAVKNCDKEGVGHARIIRQLLQHGADKRVLVRFIQIDLIS